MEDWQTLGCPCTFRMESPASRHVLIPLHSPPPQLPLEHLALGHSNMLRLHGLAIVCSLPGLVSLHLTRKQLLPGNHRALRLLGPRLRKLTLSWVSVSESCVVGGQVWAVRWLSGGMPRALPWRLQRLPWNLGVAARRVPPPSPACLRGPSRRRRPLSPPSTHTHTP